MIVELGKLSGVKVFTPQVFRDHRGFFFESCNNEVQQALGVSFVQDNHSCSKKGVIRGLHYQWEPSIGKLVRVTKGIGLDIALDIRKESSTYGQYESYLLSEENHKMVWIPPGFAHGFLSLEDNTHLLYKISGHYSKDTEGSINPFCPTLNIHWNLPIDQIILSEKDAQAQSFIEYNKQPKF
jgi:dTDP-4-dehydrorhamnose 3,5-epimerase